MNKSDPTGLEEERIPEDKQFVSAKRFDTSNKSHGTSVEHEQTQQFFAAVKSFIQKERPDGGRVDPEEIGRTAVADAKDDAGKVQLMENGKWGIEQIAAEYVQGAGLVKAGPEPGLPYKNDPGGFLPKPPPGFEGKVALIGSHAHGPQSGMKGELQKLDETSAKGAFTKGIPYISAVGSSVDRGARIQIYVPNYGYFNSMNGVTFSVGK